MSNSRKYYYKFFAACLAGLLASLSFAPTYYQIFLFISFPTLLFLLTKSGSLKESFFIGWSFGFGYFLYGLYWISNALLVDQDLFGWLVPFAVISIPAILAIYIGLPALLLHKFRQNPIKLNLLFAALWVLFEIVRAQLFTGFPWLTLGYSLSNQIVMIQSASIFGVFGLSLLVVLLVTLPFLLFTTFKHRKFFSICYALSCLLILFTNIGYGKWKLDTSETELLPYSIRIVQPNIPQSFKWDKNHRRANLEKIMSLSRSQEHEDYIIWPEAAIPYSLNYQEIRNFVKSIIPKDSYLITGGIRENRKPFLQYWTSLFVLDHNGDIVNYYDKIHLVPFGEYIPLRTSLPFNLNKITYGLLDYTKGTEHNKIIQPKITLPSFRGLICYESFFPQEIITENQHPDFLLNITNDAWYGDSPGPYQHLDITKFRAVEYGIPMIRAANTGISAVISPHGEILQQIPLNKEGVI